MGGVSEEAGAGPGGGNRGNGLSTTLPAGPSGSGGRGLSDTSTSGVGGGQVGHKGTGVSNDAGPKPSQGGTRSGLSASTPSRSSASRGSKGGVSKASGGKTSGGKGK